MNEILDNITQIIQTYEGGEWITAARLGELRRELSAQVYYLSKYKIEAKNKHNAIKYLHKGSVAAGEILAHEQCPELYQIRYITRAAENVLTSMTMEISILNKDK